MAISYGSTEDSTEVSWRPVEGSRQRGPSFVPVPPPSAPGRGGRRATAEINLLAVPSRLQAAEAARE